MVRTVKRKKRGGLTNTALSSWVSQFIGTKAQKKALEARYAELRKRLDEAISEYGYTDADGHQWLDLEEPVEGATRIKRERRVSRSLDEEAFWKIVERKGLPRKQFVKTIEVLDQDAVYAAIYVDNPKKDGLTESELDSIVTINESWAVKEVEE